MPSMRVSMRVTSTIQRVATSRNSRMTMFMKNSDR